MDLLRSYVKAVRRYLPREHRDDIVGELFRTATEHSLKGIILGSTLPRSAYEQTSQRE
jgi:hypothetical protein